MPALSDVGFMCLPQLGLSNLPEGQQDRFGGQHPALMAVRPDADLYKSISDLLCKVRRGGCDAQAALSFSSALFLFYFPPASPPLFFLRFFCFVFQR